MPKTREDTTNSILAVLADAVSVLVAIGVAVWIRFDSGWFHESWFQVRFGRPYDVYEKHLLLAMVGVVLAYLTFRYLKLYRRPQRGTFPAKVPRLLRGACLVTLELLVFVALVKNDYIVSSGAVIVFFPCFFVLLVLQRALLFHCEILAARRAVATHSVLIVGSDSTAAHLMRCFLRDPRLRVNVSGILKVTPDAAVDGTIPQASILGSLDEFDAVMGSITDLVQVIVASSDIPRRQLAHLATACERRLIRFNVVPDMFLMMTSAVEVETVDDIPLLGLRRSPLDRLGNRVVKRLEDIVGGIIGLLLSLPIIAVLAILIKRESPGPIFYSQTRCGYEGKPFRIYKLRSMRVDAERETGAVFAEENDPRRTRIGAWMRSHNMDELPQFWNVVCGQMSLVGPRPERPEFVEQFSSDIAHYMRRHAYRPGITGWAQVQGLRGNTSVEERLRQDLWYLENWSIALDIKILLKTLFAMQNAY